MVKLDIIHAQNKTICEKQFLTAVFVGGATGIGEYSVRALASAHGASGKGLRLYLVGRNELAAKKIISDCQTICPTGQFIFVGVDDLTLLKEVDRVCSELAKMEEANAKGTPVKIDLLVMTTGTMYWSGRRNTSEGLDQMMALIYYSRMRFITQLLPLLTASTSCPGRVISVFAPKRDKTMGSLIFPDDLSLERNYNFKSLGSHTAYMTTFYFEKLAANNPKKLSLSHYYPGLVDSPAFYSADLPLWSRIVFLTLKPFVSLFLPFWVPPKESGERVIYHATSRFPAREQVEKAKDVQIAESSDGVLGGGAYRTDWNNETESVGENYPQLRKDGVPELVWEHVGKVFRDIATNGSFKG